MTNAPIALFTYNRPEHLKLTLAALQRNDLAAASELYVFSDGPKSEAGRDEVLAVREVIRAISGFGKVTVFERAANLGLAQSIISGVSEIVGRHGQVIVLEDDLVTSPFFLRYMNEALKLYRDAGQVVSIHGYAYPVKAELPETFFLKGADCWGWATWKRGWELFNPDGQQLLDELRARKLTDSFDFEGAYWFTRTLEEQVNGTNNSWAIRWYASAFLKEKLTLYPGKSLVHNIGNDCSGTHCETSSVYDTEITREPVRVEAIALQENLAARHAFKKFFRSLKPSLFQRVRRRFHQLLTGTS